MIYDPATRTYLLFYSAGQWYTARYVTGFARCATPLGPCRLDARGPMLMGGIGRTGVGGLTAFEDSGGALRVAYASWEAGRENQVGPAGTYKRQTHWGHARAQRRWRPGHPVDRHPLSRPSRTLGVATKQFQKVE